MLSFEQIDKSDQHNLQFQRQFYSQNNGFGENWNFPFSVTNNRSTQLIFLVHWNGMECFSFPTS